MKREIRFIYNIDTWTWNRELVDLFSNTRKDLRSLFFLDSIVVSHSEPQFSPFFNLNGGFAWLDRISDVYVCYGTDRTLLYSSVDQPGLLKATILLKATMMFKRPLWKHLSFPQMNRRNASTNSTISENRRYILSCLRKASILILIARRMRWGHARKVSITASLLWTRYLVTHSFGPWVWD